MSVLKYILPVLAVVGAVSAQECTGTSTIQNSGDASAIASACETYSGDIVIATGTTDNIALDGIQEIDGNLIARNVSRIREISSNTLTTITGEFELNELQILSSLNFPSLTNVEIIRWIALAGLQALSFTSQVTQASVVDIQNTQLNSLEGINLELVDRFLIVSNTFLREITLQLGSISDALLIEGNAENLAVSFPELEWAFNITMRNCSSINVPALNTVNGSMGLYGGTFEGFAAPALTSVGESLSIVSNDALTNISFPELTEVGGGLQVANNTQLDSINGFPVLETVGGALDFNGNFSEAALPALEDVRGAFNMQSSEDIEELCAGYEDMAGRNDVIKGEFTCEGNQERPGGADSTPTSSGDGSSSTDESLASHFGMSSASLLGISGVVAAVLGLF